VVITTAQIPGRRAPLMLTEAAIASMRPGSVVESYDVRAAAGSDVKSLGAKFLEVDLGGIETQDAGGYAKELSEEALQRGRDMVAKHAATSDVVITTAQIPGRRAPLMLTEAAIASMRPGSVVVDLAAGTGGNCPLTKPGETVVTNGVTIMGPLNLPSTVPLNASQLYSRNLVSFLSLVVAGGVLKMDMNDEILKGACVCYQGGNLHPKLAAALGQPVA
jgi:NAD(P) transhydrogenase subunit alpha